MMNAPWNEDALVALGHALRERAYRFVTVTPETHRRVNARAENESRHAATMRDVFGWNRPFDPSVLPAEIVALANAANVVRRAEKERSLWRSRVRFATLPDDDENKIFIHSAFPTESPDAVFFGPDTIRFCSLITSTLQRLGKQTFECCVDIGCGGGPGGIVAAKYARRVLLADVNEEALAFARVNARLAGLSGEKVLTKTSDVLKGIDHEVAPLVDLCLANPPFMIDPKSRTYRDGGGNFGEGLAVEIASEAFSRLSPGGVLILYTGAAIVEGVDTCRGALEKMFESLESRTGGSCIEQWSYREIDPDIFGEEIEKNDAYGRVDRIAAVGLTAVRKVE